MEEVPPVGVLGQAGRGPESDHLPALCGRGAVGQHHQPRRRESRRAGHGARRARKRAEVEDRHVRRVHRQGGRHLRLRDVAGHQPQVRVPPISDRRPRLTMSSNCARATVIWVVATMVIEVVRSAGRAPAACRPATGEVYLTRCATPIPPKVHPFRGRKSGLGREDCRDRASRSHARLEGRARERLKARRDGTGGFAPFLCADPPKPGSADPGVGSPPDGRRYTSSASLIGITLMVLRR